MRLLPERTAVFTLIAILVAIVTLHILILSGLIPYEAVWGGRLQSHEQMVKFETTSIGINLLLIGIVSLRGRLLKTAVPPLVITIAVWLMVILFILNTVGNVLSENRVERIVFTPLTIILALLSLRLAIHKK